MTLGIRDEVHRAEPLLYSGSQSANNNGEKQAGRAKLEGYHFGKLFLKKGNYFGEIAFFTNEQRTASAKSKYFSDLFYIE
jgi:CRP-like cAMP-binding protein